MISEQHVLNILAADMGAFGYDQVIGTQHLAEDDTTAHTAWAFTNDLNHEDGDIQVSITDGQDANIAAFYAAAAGELYVAKGSAIAIGDTFQVDSSNDLADDYLADLKGSALANKDLFAVTGIGAAAAKYVGMDVFVYAFTADGLTSKMTQAYASMDRAVEPDKEYELSITIAQALAVDGITATLLKGVPNVNKALNIAAGTNVVYFRAHPDAATEDLVIQFVGSGATAGVLSITDIKLIRVCDLASHLNVNAFPYWQSIKPIGGAVTIIATTETGKGDNIASFALVETNVLHGRFTRIRTSSGHFIAMRGPQ